MSIAESPPPLSYPKLPLRNTVGLAYASFVGHFADALRASWLWLIVTAAFTAYASWQQWSWMAAMLEKFVPGQPPRFALPPQSSFLMEFDNVLVILAAVSIAVAWHRLMILNEQPGISGSNVASGNLWRYIFVGFLLCIIMIAPVVILIGGGALMMPATFGPSRNVPVAFLPLLLAAFALYIACLAVTLRLVLLLPARAVGNRDLSFGQAWQRTRGNAWRLFWGVVATTFPPLLLAQIIVMASIGFPNPILNHDPNIVMQMTATSTVMMVYYLLILPISIGFLSHAYRHFFERPLDQPR